MFFFHLRRFDDVLERDDLGLELAESDLLREADAGARGLLIESIAERTSSSYRRFEVADACGSIVLTFDFSTVLEKIRCARDDFSATTPENSRRSAFADLSMQAAGQGQTADGAVILVDDVQGPRCGIPAEMVLVAQHGTGDGNRLSPRVIDIVELDTFSIEDIAPIMDVKKIGGHCAPPGFASVGGDVSPCSTQLKTDRS